MNKIRKNNKLSNFNSSPILWFAIYIGIALAITFIVPFPLSLIVYIGIYLFLKMYRLKSIQNKYYHSYEVDKANKGANNKGSSKFFNSISNSIFDDNKFSQHSSKPFAVYLYELWKNTFQQGMSSMWFNSSKIRLDVI